MVKEKILTKNHLLYRANKTNSINGSVASINYRGAPVKYFTLTEKELNAYTKYNTTYKKTWKVTGNIRLVDILDLETRKALAEEFNRIQVNALNTAFPILENAVSRNSVDVDTDNIVLEALCEMGYDGYYMDTIKAFHSEVGLCPSAYSKLKLVKRELKKGIPRLQTKNNQRKGRNNKTKKNFGTTSQKLSFGFDTI